MLDKVERAVTRGNDKKLKPEYDSLVKISKVLVEDKKQLRFTEWSEYDIEILNKYLFLTAKPIIYLVNLSEEDYAKKKNKWYGLLLLSSCSSSLEVIMWQVTEA